MWSSAKSAEVVFCEQCLSRGLSPRTDWLTTTQNGSNAFGEVNCGLPCRSVLADPPMHVLRSHDVDGDPLLKGYADIEDICGRGVPIGTGFIASYRQQWESQQGALSNWVFRSELNHLAHYQHPTPQSHHPTDYPFWAAAPRLAPGEGPSLLPRLDSLPCLQPHIFLIF